MISKNLKGIAFVQGTPDDIEDVSTLYDELNDYLASTTNYPGWRKGIYPTRQDAIDGVRDNTLFIAKADNSTVGSVILNHKPEKGYDSADWLITAAYDDIIIIHTLAVSPQYLHKGIGQALLDFTLSYAKENGMRSIRLDVYEHNTPAIKLYARNGFEYISTVDLGLGQYGLNRFLLYERLV